MSKKTTASSALSFALAAGIPTISKEQDAVTLDVTVDNDANFEAASEQVLEAMNMNRAVMGDLAKQNATKAKEIFGEHAQVNTVNSQLNFGGNKLDVQTHRQYGDEEGEMLHNYTSATMDYDLRETLKEATSGIFED